MDMAPVLDVAPPDMSGIMAERVFRGDPAPVARLRAPFTEFPGNPAMQGLADADHFAAVTARELRTVGINMDMAPVLDVAPPDMSGIMAERVFRGDPAQVARMGCAVIEGLQTRGVIAVAKHFPGIGRTTLDSHHDLPCFTAELADLEAYELPPFQAALARGVAAVMLSHIHYPRLDPRWPASLSPAIARDLLRRRLGFNGVTVTDDLDMGAIARHFDIQTVVAQILAAEIDIVLVCHKGPNIQTAWQAIRDGLHRSADLRRLTLASVSRIAALKTRYLMPA